MDYTYLIEETANKNITLDRSINFLYILCYHINVESKYPFIQFMLEKTPFCCGLLEEEFILPSILLSVDNHSQSIEEIVLNKISNSLLSIGCEITNINASMYNGIINDNDDTKYAMVNISGTDINYLKLYRKNTLWFGLPSEIMNNGHICNIPINEDVSKLFYTMPELSLIHHQNKIDYFIIPDAVYSGSEYKDVEFNSIFGMRRKKIYEGCGEYFYFFRNFNHAIKEGGWVKEGGTQLIDMLNKTITHSVSDRLLVDNEYGRYIKGGINRYSLFVENSKIHLLDIPVSDELFCDTECLIISNNNSVIKQDIVVKEYELFFPLSFHELNKTLLGKKYKPDDENEYMIS
jgi:hypothetical protein